MTAYSIEFYRTDVELFEMSNKCSTSLHVCNDVSKSFTIPLKLNYDV